MIKHRSKNINPKIFLIEGFWGLGKTTFLQTLKASADICAHLDQCHASKDQCELSDTSSWYKTAQFKHLAQSKHRKQHFFDGSIISFYSFKYAQNGQLPPEDWNDLRALKAKYNPTVLIFECSEQFAIDRVRYIKNKELVATILQNKKFIRRYRRFYSILETTLKFKCIRIRVESKNSFKARRQIFIQLVKQLFNPPEVKVQVVSIIAFYKRQVVLLYDRTFGHYVFPQGHIELNETETDCARRELQEETGLYDVASLTKVKNYKYSYFNYDHIKTKTVHVYKAELASLARRPKKLEPHENYRNKLQSVTKAKAILNWAEDITALGWAVE
jgi:8-oxo-dGTP pyrophosphatase MutT (NUDIX family)